MNRNRHRPRTAAERRGFQPTLGLPAAKPPVNQNRAYTLRRPVLRPGDLLDPPDVAQVITRARRLMPLVEQLCVSILDPYQIAYVAEATENELQAKRLLKASARALPTDLNYAVDRVSVIGALHQPYANKYVCYSLDTTSTALIQADQDTVMKDLGTRHTRSFSAHVSLLYTSHLQLAEHIAAELEEASTFPIPLQLGTAQVFPTQYVAHG